MITKVKICVYQTSAINFWSAIFVPVVSLTGMILPAIIALIKNYENSTFYL